jgi:tRNA A-37 threonylcarbamoyl transferase component Bud32
MKTSTKSLQASQEAVAFTLPPRPVVRSYRSFRRISQIADSVPGDLAQVLRNSPDSLLERGEMLRSNGARRTVRVIWSDHTYVLKHYVEPSWRHALKQTIQTSRARTTWLFTHRLAEAGVSTPRPVACIENRWGLLRLDSYLMYPYIEGRTLRTYFTGEAKQSASMREGLWQQLNALWQRLIELRVSLGDTNLGNFILCPAGKLWLIDLDKSRFHRRAAAAAPHQERAWKQLLRSAAKCSM